MPLMVAKEARVARRADLMVNKMIDEMKDERTTGVG